MKLILVRHGLTNHNKKGRFLGDLDVSLSVTRESLSGMANKVNSYTPHLIISSPLKRCLETALAITEGDITIRGEVKELSFGEWEGLTTLEVNNNLRYVEDLKRWNNRQLNDKVGPTGGETLGQLENRVKELLSELFETYQGKTVVIVTHVYVIKCILDLAYDLPTGWHGNRLWLTNGSISLIDWHSDPEHRLVHYVNCLY